MDNVIREINESLLETISKLETRKSASQKELEAVNNKIEEKVDEAKKYKVEVDNAKNKIKELEKDIESLETDLADLNERFGKRDLNAVLEAGNKEINSKIMDKQNGITKHRQKIGELTERARSIKDLLISLKKDKTSKEEKLDILTKSYNYYSESLNKIIDYTKNNPDSLNDYDTSYNNLNYDYDNDNEPLTEVFDEIESMDKEEPELIGDNNSSDLTSSSIIDDASEIDLTPDEEAGLDDIFNKIQRKNLNIEELNKTIDDEYNNIFRNDLNEDDASLSISEKELNLPLATNIFGTTSLPENFEVPDIFGNNKLEETASDNLKISDFFIDYDLDFNKFSYEDQELLKNIFVKDHFHKILDILKNNQIDLNKIYGAASLFEKSTPEVIDQNLTKLLLSNQTKANIELVLGSLGDVNNNHLVEALNSYGANIKDTNITEIIMKAKKSAGGIDTIKKPEYLKELELNDDEITVMETNTNRDIWEYIITFPKIIMTNYNLLKDIGVTNLKEVFTGHPQMFIMNPEKFKAIFIKYDQTDLIRCLEKNASVIEKL